MFSSRTTLIIGAIAAGLAVALGAFGAHALKESLTLHNSVDTWKLAAQYHFYHALALLIIGGMMDKIQSKSLAGWAALCMLAGIVLFSGSLYVLALAGGHGVALLTPVGGSFFLTGWSLLAVAFIKNK